VLAENSRSQVIVTEHGYRTLTRAQPDGHKNPHWNNAAPVWSPDGSQIAFVTDRSGKWEIWIMNADGSAQRPMFPNGVLDELNFEFAGVDERMLSWR
jgi:Tol biopolymer transport system component